MNTASNPLVSAIIPVGPRHSEHCRIAAASVQNQSLAHLCETILIEDGGANIPEMANCTILRGDGERRGPAHTRNRGIAAAKGLFILPLDSDDYLLPHAVENMLREYGRGTHGYIYGDAYTLERDGRHMLRPAPEYIQNHMRHHNIHVVNILLPTKFARQVGGYDEGVDAWEDWSFHLRLAIAGICGHRLPQPIFVYRVYEGDRMTRFYGGAPELMEKVLIRYRTKEGTIPMASCCGGDSDLARIAQQAALGAPLAPAALMSEGKVRVEYLGDDKGAQTWEYPFGQTIRLGNNPIDRYRDVTPAQAEWLQSIGVPIRVVPIFDSPEPPSPLPILQPTDVLTPDAQTKVLRPKGAK